MPQDPPAWSAMFEAAVWRLVATPRGLKAAVENELIAATGLSRATVRRRLAKAKPHVAGAGRKCRSDAGSSALTMPEARAIAAYLMESVRQTGKRLADIGAAVEALRASGVIVAARKDPETGELVPLSISAIARALKRYHCHPDQLARPAPKVSLRSLHPNHVWQIDPSLCVLYYLKREDGLRVMPQSEFYKNKPKNLKRIENDRVWRYVFTDHASGAFYVEYVLGAETGKNLCETFINAMQRRDGDPFCGAPKMIMVDPGSANTGAMAKSLCAALGIEVQVNQPGQPWAKGQVEKTNDIVEREFEHRLAFSPRVRSLDELNDQAWGWMRHYQAYQPHTRHGLTRYACWLTIAPEALRIPPEPAVCRRFAAHAPQTRVVSVHLRVSFRGEQYDVRQVPGVNVGDRLQIARNAWDDERTAHVLGFDADRRATCFVVPRRERGDYGFFDDSVVIGGEYRPHKDTPADTARKALERLVMDADTDEEAAAKRKAGALPFGGRIAPMPEAPNVAYVPRRGSALPVDAPALVDLTVAPAARPRHVPELPPYTHAEAFVSLRPLVQHRGLQWSAAMMAATVARYPDGVPYQEIEAWAEQLWQRYRLQPVPREAPR